MIYLDYSASAPISEAVLDRMIEVYRTDIGNPDSRTHEFGANAMKIVKEAQNQVADLLGTETQNIFFTSGATESNNMAIQGLIRYACQNNKKHIVSSSIERLIFWVQKRRIFSSPAELQKATTWLFRG